MDRIPIEILGRVFHCLQLDWEIGQSAGLLRHHWDPESYTSDSNPLPLLTLRPVCRRWNAAVEGAQDMWRHVTPRFNAKFIEKAFNCVKSGGLDVVIEVPGGEPSLDWNESCTLILTKIELYRSLCVILRPVSPENVNLPNPTDILASSTFPLLELLMVYCGNGSEYAFDGNCFFGKVPLRLRTLRLFDGRIREVFKGFQAALTTATFVDCDFGPATSDFLGVLGQLPFLQVLVAAKIRHLEDMDVAGYADEPDGRVTLSQLERLELSMSLGCLLYMCYHIKTPATCEIDADGSLVDVDEVDEDEVRRALDEVFKERVCGANQQQGYERLSIEYSDSEEGCPDTTVALLEPLASSSGPRSFTLRLESGDHRRRMLRSWALHVVGTWSAVSHAKSVAVATFADDLSSEEWAGARFWWTVLSSAPSVETIQVRGKFGRLSHALKSIQDADFPFRLTLIELRELELTGGNYLTLAWSLRVAAGSREGGAEGGRLRLLYCKMDGVSSDIGDELVVTAGGIS
ncbi:hypothetical protein PENSPDRAFT_690301 [Peniophora sp. CONT]|nr:hypothetical protein PENSPDRAFT_690301 [Peniophora sp. CONT]